MYEEIKKKCTPEDHLDSIDYFEFIDSLKYNNIIDVKHYEVLNCNEKKDYLIEKNIFIKGSKRVFSSSENPEDYLDFKDFNSSFHYNDYGYDIKEDIIEEFYNYLYRSIETEYALFDTPRMIFEYIDKHIKYLLSIEDKLDYLKKKYDETLKNLTSHGFHESYLDGDLYNNEYDSFKYYITQHFDEELYVYLTEGAFYGCLSFKNCKNYGAVEYWERIYSAKKTMDYCKALLDYFNEININSNTNSQNISELAPKEIEPYSSRVFKGEHAESILLQTLKEFNVLTDSNLADNGFQAFCESFWRVGKYNSFQEFIFHKNVKKSHFINHLNKKYNAGIKESAKGTLSYNPEHDYSVENFIKLCLKDIN